MAELFRGAAGVIMSYKNSLASRGAASRDTRAHMFVSRAAQRAHPTPHAMPNEPVSIRDDVVQHNILAAYYVMYRIFAVAQAGGAVPGGHS